MLGRVVTVRTFSHRLIGMMSHRYHRGWVGGGVSFEFSLLFLGFKYPVSTVRVLSCVSPVPECLGPPLERNCKPGARINRNYLLHIAATSRTQHTGGFTPCADGPHDGPGAVTIPPSPHHLKFTEKSMQCNMYKKVTIHV